MKIQLTWKHPVYIGQAEGLCMLKFRFGDGQSFMSSIFNTPMEKDTEVKRRLRLQIDPNDTASASIAGISDAVKALMNVLAAAGPAATFIFGASLSSMVAMVEGMQLLVHYPMMMMVSPPNVEMLQ